ncbi:VOC family protein [Oricola cellulosilytica]|uniref:VOC family protein n=1 Tax=Oricola cellulosilytica TaxID=1429082 RepID=A0A4R0PDW5_9HYPH|nr:VOC family protein [Oricola cellulosilytica]TCD13436.1 VOC family protein [Oricola cellulosilytica]
MTPHGMVHWTELQTHDAGKAKSFYGHTLGWTFDAMPMPDGTQYHLCMSGDEMAGGMFTMTDPQFKDVPEHWMTYFSVDDVDARLITAKEAGATVLREPFDVPGVGRIAILQAPGGAAMGWMTPAEPA